MESILLKLRFMSLLRMARQYYSLKKLSAITGIDPPTLSKYINGKLIPSNKRIHTLLPLLMDIVDPYNELRNSLVKGTFQFPELNNILNEKPYLLQWSTIEILDKVKGLNFNKILTVEGGGLALAACLGILSSKPIVYGIRNVVLENSVVEPYKVSDLYHYSPKLQAFISFPKHALNRRDRVLVVDDIVWTGATIRALIRIATRLGTRVVGAAVLAAHKGAYNDLIRELNVPVYGLISVE